MCGSSGSELSPEPAGVIVAKPRDRAGRDAYRRRLADLQILDAGQARAAAEAASWVARIAAPAD